MLGNRDSVSNETSSSSYTGGKGESQKQPPEVFYKRRCS